MSKFVILCKRRPSAAFPAGLASGIASRIQPDNIDIRPPLTYEKGGLMIVITSPPPHMTLESAACCVGQILGSSGDWRRPGSELPDGTYAICRADDTVVELATDVLASRQVWYAIADDVFVASSSQRAIVSILGDFQPNPQTAAWMLSSGTLGPGCSWDRRISRMRGSARLQLRRDVWEVHERADPIEFDPRPLPVEEHERLLRDELKRAFNDLHLDLERWRLPLSGGYDSRFLLLMLHPRPALRCLTWGQSAALDRPSSDAVIARQLAECLGVPHDYYVTDSSHEPLDRLVTRFLVNGEGVVDHISGYMDGFQIWRELHDAGIDGTIRGDECFGWHETATVGELRQRLGCPLLSDYFTSAQLESLELPVQTWPESMARDGNESLHTWRDRLYQSFRIPVVLAGLTEMKANYVEIVNPLLSRRVVSLVRSMPDVLRTEKALFRKIVRSMSPPVPFASHGAVASNRKLMETKPFLRWSRELLESSGARRSLPDPLISNILSGLPRRGSTGTDRRSFGSQVKGLVPLRIRQRLRRIGVAPTPAIPWALLGFRAALVVRMHEMLAEDAKAGRELSPCAGGTRG